MSETAELENGKATEEANGLPTEMVPGLPSDLVDHWKEVKDAEAAYQNFKKVAVEARKAWQNKRAEFEKAFQAATEQCPLFDSTAKEESKEPVVGPDGEDESWRGELLSKVFQGLSSGIVEKCYQAELQTLGQLSDFLNSGKNLTDIPGIGAMKAEMMEQAMTAYWQKRSLLQEKEVAHEAE